jgi:hypothetical protein
MVIDLLRLNLNSGLRLVTWGFKLMSAAFRRQITLSLHKLGIPPESTDKPGCIGWHGIVSMLTTHLYKHGIAIFHHSPHMWFWLCWPASVYAFVYFVVSGFIPLECKKKKEKMKQGSNHYHLPPATKIAKGSLAEDIDTALLVQETGPWTVVQPPNEDVPPPHT